MAYAHSKSSNDLSQSSKALQLLQVPRLGLSLVKALNKFAPRHSPRITNTIITVLNNSLTSVILNPQYPTPHRFLFSLSAFKFLSVLSRLSKHARAVERAREEN
jgi:hypothetical protein